MTRFAAIEQVREARPFIANAEISDGRREAELAKFDAALALLQETLEAAQAHLEHTEGRDYRRGHTNTSCPPLTRAMCKQYMRLRAALARVRAGAGEGA